MKYPEDNSLPASPLKAITAILFLVLINCIGPMRWWHIDYLSVDLSETLYHARELAVGRVPYREIVTHHFLGYAYFFALIDLLVGLTPTVVKILQLIANLISAFALCACTVLLTGNNRLGLFAALLGVTIGWAPGIRGDTFNLPNYIVPLLWIESFLILAAAKHCNTRYLFAASIIAGVSLCCDQRLVLFLPLLCIPHITGRIRVSGRDLLIQSICILSFPAVWIFTIWWNGALQDFFSQTILFPLNYRNKGLPYSKLEVVSLLFLRVFQSQLIVSITSSIALLLTLRFNNLRYLRLFIIMSLLSSFGYIYAGGRPFAHYMVLLSVPVLLSLSLTFAAGVGASSAKKVVTIVASAVLLLEFFWQSLGSFATDDTFFLPPPTNVVDQAADYINAHSPSDASLIVWGYKPQLYLMTNRLSPFREVGLIGVGGANFDSVDIEKQGIEPSLAAEFEHMMKNNPPDIFLYYRVKDLKCLSCFGLGPIQKNMEFETVSHLSYLKEVVHSQYSMSESFESEYDRVDIYTRRTEAYTISRKP